MNLCKRVVRPWKRKLSEMIGVGKKQILLSSVGVEPFVFPFLSFAFCERRRRRRRLIAFLDIGPTDLRELIRYWTEPLWIFPQPRKQEIAFWIQSLSQKKERLFSSCILFTCTKFTLQSLLQSWRHWSKFQTFRFWYPSIIIYAINFVWVKSPMKGEISSTWALALGLYSKTKFGKIVFPVFAVNMLCKGRWALGILKKT